MHSPLHHVVVLGLGSSGAAAAHLLRREGAQVTVLDGKAGEAQQALRAELEQAGVRVLLGQPELPDEAFDLCVVSPGVPVSLPWIQTARARGLPVRAELELGWSRRGPATKVIAVTGSNGKSNAVKWMAESLAEAGLSVAIAGNYGPPVCRVVLEQPRVDWLVLEVSSFQLETVHDFRAELGILLNLVPNHLDRHGDFATYREAKARLFARSQPGDACLVHEACAADIRAAAGGAGAWYTFGTTPAAAFAYAQGQVRGQGRLLADVSGTYFGNEVLGCNAAGVIGALACGGLEVAAAERAARLFRPLPNRMELVAEACGVRFINDSKSTTLTALGAAVRMCPGRVRLIAGGLLKEVDLTSVKEVLAQRAAGVYLIGKASDQMATEWSDVTRCVKCGTLAAAVQAAWREAQPGETIILSPGCASFDQFRNFEDRGEQFRQQVRPLAGE